MLVLKTFLLFLLINTALLAGIFAGKVKRAFFQKNPPNRKEQRKIPCSFSQLLRLGFDIKFSQEIAHIPGEKTPVVPGI